MSVAMFMRNQPDGANKGKDGNAAFWNDERQLLAKSYSHFQQVCDIYLYLDYQYLKVLHFLVKRLYFHNFA